LVCLDRGFMHSGSCRIEPLPAFAAVDRSIRRPASSPTTRNKNRIRIEF
jgi:hypothetical protein